MRSPQGSNSAVSGGAGFPPSAWSRWPGSHGEGERGRWTLSRPVDCLSSPVDCSSARCAGLHRRPAPPQALSCRRVLVGAPVHRTGARCSRCSRARWGGRRRGGTVHWTVPPVRWTDARAPAARAAGPPGGADGQPLLSQTVPAGPRKAVGQPGEHKGFLLSRRVSEKLGPWHGQPPSGAGVGSSPRRAKPRVGPEEPYTPWHAPVPAHPGDRPLHDPASLKKCDPHVSR